jgi:hypothetical protein
MGTIRKSAGNINKAAGNIKLDRVGIERTYG